MDEIDAIQEADSAAQETMLRERRRLADLAAAMTPPESRECSSCGCDIPKARLKARPMARLCVDCQEEAEETRR